ncbi:MAG TPA: ABC transporter ATP-binding protein [Geminicoccaceae bacterium]|nr:ABC transporter ATP-binding protein [Geminicoccaceae bacterium]
MVHLDRVSKRFGDQLAVDDVSFALAERQFLTILGPSGSGKTTLLRMIAGFIAPTSGGIAIHGRRVANDPPYARSIGMVFQRLALFPHLSAAENVAYPLRMRGWPKREIFPRVERYLELVRLGGLGGRRIHELSGGQQQRVAVARALVFEPDLLLLDEPLAALDRKLREDMQLEFRRIQQELGVTTINVTHDQREALVMSDRVIVMDHGRIQQDAAPTETYGKPANRFVAGFIGVTNFLPAELVRLGGAGWAEVRIGGQRLLGRCGATLRPGAAVEVALRAERIGLCPPGEGAAPGFDAEVREVIFEGDRLVYGLHVEALGGMRLLAFDYDRGVRTIAGVGERVGVTWRPDDLMIFPATTNDEGARNP